MLILGLEPIVAAVVFTIVGAGLQLGLGFLGSKDPFDGRKALSTALVTVVVGIVIVSTAFQAIADTATDLEIIIIVAGIIATIAGVDALKNSVIAAATKNKA